MTGKEILEAIKQMSPEEGAALAAELNKLQKKTKPKAETVMLGEPMHDPQAYDRFGKPLSDEEIYDRNHPLTLLSDGYYQVVHVFGQPPKREYLTKAEIDRRNKEKKRAWLEEKRKVFPSAVLPGFDE